MSKISLGQAAYIILIILAGLTAYGFNISQTSTQTNMGSIFELFFIFDILLIIFSSGYYILTFGRDLLKIFTKRRI